MKKYLGMMVALTALVVAAGSSYQKLNARMAESDAQVDRQRIRSEYLERVGWIRSNPSEEAYKEELSGFFSWYFSQVSAHQAKFGGNAQFDDYLKELEQRGGKDPQAQDKKAYHAYVKN